VKTTLPNGLTVVLKEQHHSPVVAMQMWVNVGSADETEAQAGLSHVVEHMLFKGTETRGVGDVAREIEASGGDINAFTSFDHTVYQVVVASRFAGKAMEVLADALINPRFAPEEIDKEREVILEEIKRSEDSPSQVASKLLFRTAYTLHPYRRPVIGYEEVIRSVDEAGLRAFFSTWYRAENMILAAAGDFRPEDFLRVIEDRFALVPGPLQAIRRSVVEPPQREPRMVTRRQSINETHLDLCWHLPDAHHPDTYPLDLLSIILGQGDSSWLYHSLKTERNLINAIFSCAFVPKDPGIFMVSATLAGKNLYKVVDAVLEQIDRLKHGEISDQEFQRARTIVEKDYTYQRETVQGQARKMGYFESVMHDYRFEEQYLQKLASLGREDVRSVAEQYFTPDNLTVVVLGPESEPEVDLAVLREPIERYRAQPAAKRSAPSNGPQMLTLENGLRVIVKPNRHVPLVSVKLSFLAGLRYETPACNGINNLIASTLTKGTLERSALDIAQQIESMGGSIKSGAGRNSFFLHMDLLSRYFLQGIEVFTDILFNPSFQPDTVEKEKQSIYQEILAQEDNLPALAFKLFNRTLFAEHPFGLPLLGTRASLEPLDRTDLEEYYRRIIRPEGAVLTLVGDLDPEATLRLVGDRFSALTSPSPLILPEQSDLGVDEPRTAELIKNKKQAHIVMGFKGVNYRNPDRYTLEIITALLAGQSGRLFIKLRDQQSLAYSLTSFNIEGMDTGYCAIYIATSPEKIDQALDGIRREIELLRTERVGEEELERAKKYIVGNYEIDLQSNQSQATSLNFNELYGVGHRETFLYPERIMARTPEDVTEVCRRYFNLSRSVTAIVRPGELG